MKLQSFVNYEGQNSEIIATYILKELGYKIIHSFGLENRKMVTKRNFTWYEDNKLVTNYKKSGGKYTGDIICKMEKQYFVFDVKLKLFREDKNMNMFTVTNNEIVNYSKLTKSGKISVKILINLKKDDEYYYGIFDWNDFKYSKNFDPNKTRSTSIRLADGLDISKLTKFENIKNYKFEKYLEYAHIKQMKYDDRMAWKKKAEAEIEKRMKGYEKSRKKYAKMIKIDIEKNWDYYTSNILAFLNNEKEKQKKRTEKQEKRYTEKFEIHKEYRKYCPRNGADKIRRRYFDQIMKLMKDKKMVSFISSNQENGLFSFTQIQIL